MYKFCIKNKIKINIQSFVNLTIQLYIGIHSYREQIKEFKYIFSKMCL